MFFLAASSCSIPKFYHWDFFLYVDYTETFPCLWWIILRLFFLIPMEKDSADIRQFCQISLLNVEGRIFCSVVAHRLTGYLEKNYCIDTSVQKDGIPGFSGCLEHTNVMWHQIQAAKKGGKYVHVIFLDFTNAFGSVPHSPL